MYKISATVAEIGNTVSIGEKGFTKRVLILETNEKFPQFVQIEFQKTDTSLLDVFDTGENVTVSFNINGRKWISPDGEVKYFNTLKGYKIEAIKSNDDKQIDFNKTEKPVPLFTAMGMEEDDLPF